MKLKRLFILCVSLCLLAACSNNEPVTPQATAVPATEAAVVPTTAATATPIPTTESEPPTEAPTATAAATISQTYTSEAGAYTLDYPGTATLFENERPSADGVLSPAPDSVSLLEETTPGYLLTLAHFNLDANTSLADFVNNHSECVDVTAENGEAITLSGEPALFFPDVACGLVGSSYIYLVKGNMGYRFTLETTANYAAVEAAVQPILDSFASSAAVPGLTQIYYNETADFSLRLPNEWTVGETTDSPLGQMILVGPRASSQDASHNRIVVAEADDITVEELAATMLCGSANDCEAPELQAVTLRNGIAAHFAAFGSNGQPEMPWYFVESNGHLIALTMHDAETLASLEAIVQSFTQGHILEIGADGFPAAQAARVVLAQQLGVNPYQIAMAAVQSAEWPDGCLGVRRMEVLCTQVVTPGYIVTAEVDGRYYQLNTNESGSSLVRVPGAVPPIGGIALTEVNGEQCTAVIFHAESGVQAGFCEGELTSYTNDTSESATQLNELLSQYAPFHTQTPIGTLTFSGLGDEVADPTVQRQIAELTRFYTDIIISGRASAASQLAFSWARNGGIAGFCDDLAVYMYGLALANSCKQETPDNGGQLWLTSEQLAQIYEWVDRFASFELDQSDPPDVSDGLSLLLAFHGNGQETATATDQQVIADFAMTVFAQASGLEAAVPSTPFTFVPHTVSGDAGEVVGAFLAALLEDETGQSSVVYLNEALQQQVRTSQTVTELLGFADHLSAYEYAITDNGRGDGVAVVEATLNETNPVHITFTLTRQDEFWYISQIVRQ